MKRIQIRILLFLSLAVVNLPSCSTVGVEGAFEPYAIPLKISINSWGEISLTVETDVEIPTPLGTASIGLILDPARHFNTMNTLTVRINGTDYFYDLHGNDFNIDFESGYYKQISLIKRSNDLLLVVESLVDSPPIQVEPPVSSSSGSSGQGSVIPSSDCPGALKKRLNIGDRAEVIIYQLSVRSAPGLSYSKEHVLAEGRSVDILDGPICADTAWWWKIYFSGQISTGDVITFEGWMMEADYDTYYLRKTQ